MEQITKEMVKDLDQDQVDQLNEILLNTQEQCQMMEQVLMEQIKKKDSQIDLLHKELEYYKQDQADKLINQAMKELISLRNQLLKTIQSEAWENMSEKELKKTLIYLEEDMTDLLQRQEIDPFTSLPGENFDAGKHKATVIPTDDDSLDRKVQKSTSPGYIKRGKVLIPEAVVIYRKIATVQDGTSSCPAKAGQEASGTLSDVKTGAKAYL